MKTEDKKIVDVNGYWEIKHNPISRVGVFPYLGRQISSSLEPNKVYNVYRPAEELFKEETKESFKLVPFTDEHTMLGDGEGLIPAERKGIHGVTGEEIDNDNETLYINLKIYSEELKNKIEEGKKELSLGYFCNYDLQQGEYKGEHYDAIQRNIKGNHLALVKEGRMGADVRVMDSMTMFSKDIDINNDKIENNLLTKQKELKMENENIDKRKDISEIEAMLFEAKKDPSKLDDEFIKTIIQKVENNSYDEENKEEIKEENKDEVIEEKKENLSEESKDEEPTLQELNKKIDLLLDLLTKDGEDACKDEEVNKEEVKDEEKEKKAMDSMLTILANQENIYKQARELVGDFDYRKMNANQIAKYTCDKLDIECKEKDALNVLKGYIKANNRNNVKYSMDKKATYTSEDAEIEKYKNINKK